MVLNIHIAKNIWMVLKYVECEMVCFTATVVHRGD
jgi:hypothetical protein